MSDEEAREALEEVLADGLWRLYQDPNGNPGVLIHEDPRTTAHAVLSIILASGLVVTTAEADRRVEEAERKIAAVRKVQESPFYLRTQRRGFTQEDYSRPLIESSAISVALLDQVTEGKPPHE